MVFRLILIILVVLLILVVILPFVLNLVGIQVFQFGSVGGGRGTGVEVLLISSDGGKNWKEAEFHRERRIPPPSQTLDIGFHPQNPDIFFMGTKGAGLWKSIDGGKSWEKIFDASRVLNPQADVYRVAVSPSSPDTLYLAVFQNNRGRVLRSEDGGKSFREIYFVTANRFGIFDIFVDPNDARHVVLITGQGGVLETRNSGNTWRVVKWFSEALTRLIVNPIFSNEMFTVTSSGKLFKTFDGGENWTELTEGVVHKKFTYPPEGAILNPFAGLFTRSSIEALIPDPSLFTTLYLGTKEGLFRTVDGGFSWERLNVLIPPEALPVNAVAVHPYNPALIFMAAGQQLYQSSNAAETWSVITLPTSARVKKLLVNPLRPDTMLAVLGR